MEEKQYILKVYNTLTGVSEEINVSSEVYHTYRRTAWNIEDNDDSYYNHEIQFSVLIGGDDDGFENFDEFILEETPESTMEKRELMQKLYRALDGLDADSRRMMIALFFEGLSEREYARRTGVSQKTINNRKRAILKKWREKNIF